MRHQRAAVAASDGHPAADKIGRIPAERAVGHRRVAVKVGDPAAMVGSIPAEPCIAVFSILRSLESLDEPQLSSALPSRLQVLYGRVNDYMV